MTLNLNRPAPVTGTFTATGQSSSFAPVPLKLGVNNYFNLEIRGTFSATVVLERSFDGTNWVPLTGAGTAVASFTGAASEQIQEIELGVLYRLNCTVYSSGTVTYRLSQ